MTAPGLVQWFMRRRQCSFAEATRLAEKVVIRRKEQVAVNKVKLSTAQLTLPLDNQPQDEEPTHPFEVDDPTVNF